MSNSEIQFHFAKIYSVNKGDKARKIAWSHWINLLKYEAAGELVFNFSREQVLEFQTEE